MDYYSSFPMPSREDRVKELIEYSKTLVVPFPQEELIVIVHKIVDSTPEYSLTGYHVFANEKGRLKNEISLYNK